MLRTASVVTLLALNMLLGGCVDPNLRSVSYKQSVATQSDMTGIVQLFTGVVEGANGSTMVYIGPGLFMPMETGPYPNLHFNEADQRVFTESLSAELTRLGLLKMKTVVPAGEMTDVVIVLAFVQTSHNPHLQQYYLDVAMQIASSGKSTVKQYKVHSSEGDGYWEKMNTDAAEGKQKAADKLIALIVPDIEIFIAEMKAARQREAEGAGA
ncbi:MULTISPECIES: hypothetical protein [Alphaproteobacteria]|jgi:hypothetical protein|uniref:hypothetical protein n=1 Tax=Alphaproteobacteria TaxID=28211 RepID=UPI003299F11E